MLYEFVLNAYNIPIQSYNQPSYDNLELLFYGSSTGGPFLLRVESVFPALSILDKNMNYISIIHMRRNTKAYNFHSSHLYHKDTIAVNARNISSNLFIKVANVRVKGRRVYAASRE